MRLLSNACGVVRHRGSAIRRFCNFHGACTRKRNDRSTQMRWVGSVHSHLSSKCRHVHTFAQPAASLAELTGRKGGSQAELAQRGLSVSGTLYLGAWLSLAWLCFHSLAAGLFVSF